MESELWGGIECTINRIGNEYKDQLRYSGHYDRPGDIQSIADIGIKRIRYPILWEKHQAERDKAIDWRWIDQQMDSIRSSGMIPIAGLVHHGSGPSYTNLLDPDFPYLLASYAYEVASRFPWIEYYTPVNEPLTTARFSGLYGLWYPHHTSEGSFYRMLLNQLKATILSMEAICSINPLAKLVQTEDLGKTYSTDLLAYQAKFENERRLLTFDILTGCFQPDHPQYTYMLGCGIKEEELEFFAVHRIKPDILGLNYYVTSERWLDESLEKYDHHTHGGNGIHKYADTEVVRANPPARGGFSVLAREIWDRYSIPIAVTEAHLHCTREEQLRWFKEIWDDVCELKKEGVDVRGVAAWALLGSFDWDSLLTKTGTQYESGAFDIQTKLGELRPTALVTLLKTLADDGHGDLHPVTNAPGWWRGPNRLNNKNLRPLVILDGGDEARLFGLKGKMLSDHFALACKGRRISYVLCKHVDQVLLENLSPWAVIDLSKVDNKIGALCISNSLPYATFSEEKVNDMVLTVILQADRVTIHQVNKVLDLMIDEDKGCWILGSAEITFKSENLASRSYYAQ